MDRGLYLTATGKAVSFYGMGNEASRKHADSISQITINTEARDVLKDLFPNIPDNDLNQIIKTAFQKVRFTVNIWTRSITALTLGLGATQSRYSS
jgi:hypothetical protein